MFLDVCYVYLVNVIAFPGSKSQFPGLDRDSRFRPSTYLRRNRSWIVGGGAWVVGDAGPHCRLRTITQPVVACPKHRKTAGGRVREECDRSSAMADWPRNRTPTSDAARQLVVVASARRMGVFNGGQRSGLRRCGTCVETRARKVTERGGKGGVAIVDRTPGTGDQRPAVAIGRHCGRSVHLMSALTRL